MDPDRNLAEILAELQITDWDVLLAGDGSGSGWDQGCGWACVLIERVARLRQLFYGGMNAGSINLAEFLPYLQALLHYHATLGKSRLESRGIVKVHIITDSRVIAHCGNIAADPTQPLPKMHRVMFSTIRQLVAEGYHIHYHWADRCSTTLNQIADLIATLGRRGAQAAQSPQLNQGQALRLQRVEQQLAAALTNPAADLRPLLVDALRATGFTLDMHGSLAHRAARQMQRIRLTDPRTGEEINLQELNCDEPSPQENPEQTDPA